MGKERASVPLGWSWAEQGNRCLLCWLQTHSLPSLPMPLSQPGTGLRLTSHKGETRCLHWPCAGPPSLPRLSLLLPGAQTLPSISGQFLPSERKTGSCLVSGTTSPLSSCLPGVTL